MMKTVLYINGKLAVWMLFERDVCINVHAESLTIDRVAYKPCDWLSSKHQLVHLVLDSEHAEIEAVPLKRAGTALQQLTHTWALRESLVNRFPGSIIRTPKKHTGIDALLVHQLRLSDLCRTWLSYVENSTVTFCSVAASEESVARLISNDDQPYLVVTHALGYCKHTFCRSGFALFSRTFELAAGSSIVEALDETLSHLNTTEFISTSVRVYTIGCSEHQLRSISELNGVKEHISYDDGPLMERDEKNRPSGDNGQYSAVMLIARQVLAQSLRSQLRSNRYVNWTLAKYAHLVRYRQSLIRLSGILFIAICSVAFCVSLQWQNKTNQRLYTQNKTSLLLSVITAKQALYNENPDGLLLSDALLKSQALKSSVGPSSAMLLTTLATVFTEHRELVLQQLTWTTIDSPSEHSEYAQPDSAHITSREFIDTESIAASTLAVGVVGQGNPNSTLREQQSAINELVAALQSYSAIADLVVLEAPLSRTATDERIGANALDKSTSFRIQFQLERRLIDEA